MAETLVESLRRTAEHLHSHADRILRDCTSRPPCDGCRRIAEGYKTYALDYASRAVRQDLIARGVA